MTVDAQLKGMKCLNDFKLFFLSRGNKDMVTVIKSFSKRDKLTRFNVLKTLLFDTDGWGQKAKEFFSFVSFQQRLIFLQLAFKSSCKFKSSSILIY